MRVEIRITSHETTTYRQPAQAAGFVAPASAREKLSSRVLDEADKSLEYTLTAVRGNIDGLTATEAANRLIQFGPNEVTTTSRPMR